MIGPILRKYGELTRVYLPLYEVDGIEFNDTPATFASGDVRVSVDGGTFDVYDDVATGPVHEGQGIYSFELSATELTGKKIVVTVRDAATKTWLDTSLYIETYGHASAQHAFDLGTAEQSVDVAKWLGTTVATPTVAGVPEIDITHVRGTAAQDTGGLLLVDVWKWRALSVPIANVGGVPISDPGYIQGVAQSATDLKDFADNGYDPATNKVEGVKTTDVNSDMRGTDSAALASVCTEARLDELAAANLPADIDTIKAKTDALPDSILAAVVEGTITLKQAIALIGAAVAGETVGVETGVPQFKAMDDPATTRVTAVIASNNRTSVVLTPP